MSRPLLIAHRGASRHCPENTLAAFERAIAEGADWIELDLQPIRDGVAVFHDDELLRLIGREGRIHEQSLAELPGLLVSGDEPIPSLQQLLEQIGPRRPLYLELKSDGGGLGSARNRALLDAVCGAVPPDAPHALASFDPELVREVHARGYRAVLIFAEMAALDHVPAGDLFALSSRHHLLEQGVAERARELGRPLWIWTVDEPEDIEWALRAGATGICSNDVPTARRVLDGWSA